VKRDKHSQPHAPKVKSTGADWRIGRTLADVFTDRGREVLDGLGEGALENAQRVIITSVSHSPRRRQYQIATRFPDGKGTTAHFPESYVRSQP
jgi:hypothetical protein